MSYSGLKDFINDLEKNNELLRIKEFIDPVLEITEITDRITKSEGKALLFENNGTDFPVLINAFGSDLRMAMAAGRKSLLDPGKELEKLLTGFSLKKTFFKKLSSLPELMRFAAYLPNQTARRGACQKTVIKNPDLSILPVLKCWPHDGGRFITLPMVHTIHPDSGSTNVGMYRMQVLNKNTTGMHWQRHKTGANHFEAWKKCGRKMPVSVALGGDPVYTYASTAPLPENINEYILAGFLRKKKVSLVKCLTNELYVPEDADIILEGFVDPAEEPVWEGPFGDHTGFYSLAGWYPAFHITCITHSGNAVYPATIVGIPPQEDSWIAKATEKFFLAPVKMTLQPEVEDFHMPDAGVAHNLMIIKIRKSYPGQGMKVINSLSGAGQMMFTKYMIVVSGEVDIRNYGELTAHILRNADLSKDILFSNGPLDVLDHSSDNFSFGGKAGIDATIKMPEEISGRTIHRSLELNSDVINALVETNLISKFNLSLCDHNIPIVIISINRSASTDVLSKVKDQFLKKDLQNYFKVVIAVDDAVDVFDYFMVAWQVLGNSDPSRDHHFLSSGCVLFDGTVKAFRTGGFPRKWPNIVTSSEETISVIDKKWNSLGIGEFLKSPSLRYNNLKYNGTDEIIVDHQIS